MAVAIATIESLIVAALNLADSYTVTPADGSRAYANQIRDAVLSADAQVCHAFLSVAEHAARVPFIGSQSVAHGAVIPAHIGPIDAVLLSGLSATIAPADQIEAERILVTLGVTEITPHYNVIGNTLIHNSSSNATVKLATFTGSSSVCQAPDEYAGAVYRGAMSIVGSPEGESPEILAQASQDFARDLMMIMKGEIPAGPPTIMERAA